MFPALVLSTFTLLGTLANGLDCTFTERCRSGLCDSVEAPAKVLFSASAIPNKPAIFVLGDRRLFEGEPVTEAAAPAVRRMFRDFQFKPDAYVYGPGGLGGYEPANGSVQVLVGGRAMNVTGEGAAEVFTIREGMPGLDWITRFSGHCSARTYE